ncbi:Vitamin B12 ABC transporter, B12-binding component BtuF [Thioalkalivibrio nitratireducens DSM 14787]|uniref:Vitamin B12 ABC transporter, B12-binding component BtuF n=1 Tax=Thioalkalivibrio nitratireducens (strain DSM 14787 / UNIQEM 213 / ALEN2) TaxID=1255043 RepID=L0DTV1_THIND|nr:cobalamin-binding protein [Thioalkalivibrio nitratireducens]AGA33029.1 Vitamin B12 ABC transporter, B12-binding component BtuF [Thioalkalivibrio nitratireducens DSM 14787]
MPGFRSFLCVLFSALLPLAAGAASGVTVTDDLGREVVLEQPAQRIVSLTPHLTELLFAAGAGERIVGTVEHADYPPPALKIPRVGTAAHLDLERILELEPDLLLAWASGSPRTALERLERLGLAVYYSEPADLAGIAADLRRLGRLAGQPEVAEAAARAFEAEIDALRRNHAHRRPVTVFYQVWDRPLMTVNDGHLIGEAIRLCGGRNLFGSETSLVPRPDREAVLAADPEAIVTGGPGEDRPDWLQPWREWGALTAVRRDNLFFVPPSLLQRHTPRIADGALMLCEALELARARRPEP